MKRQTIVAFGATSAICQAVLRRYAADGAMMVLAARNQDKLDAIAQDLQVRGANIVELACYDFAELQEHTALLARASEQLGNIDLMIVAHGTLPDQAEGEVESSAVGQCMSDNFTSAAVIAQGSAEVLQRQGVGTLAVISSVAGDRGRKSNYVYGAAKAGLNALLQGLQGRFADTDVKVVVIKPGMVITPMTAHMRHGALWSTPEAVAPAIERAIARGRSVAYVPGYWRYIMWVIRALPTGLLARLPI